MDCISLTTFKIIIRVVTRKARWPPGCSTIAPIAIGRMDGPTTPQLRVCSNRPHGRRRRDAGPSAGPSARLGVATQTSGGRIIIHDLYSALKSNHRIQRRYSKNLL